MCLIIFAHQADPRFPLVLTANRDEFFNRPTVQADFWTESSKHLSILAGRDLVAGGTWLGLSKSGRFAAVTNIRDPSQVEQKPKSRGELTVNFLAGELTPVQYCDSLEQSFDEFAGYNLLVGDEHELFYVNNFEGKILRLEAGIYGLSNGSLNSPWPKVERGRERLKGLLAADSGLTTDQLIEVMTDKTRARDELLPDTGVPIELEIKLSSAFIQNPERLYGTRCSTAIIHEAGGVTRFSEQNYDDSGNRTERSFYQFERSR